MDLLYHDRKLLTISHGHSLPEWCRTLSPGSGHEPLKWLRNHPSYLDWVAGWCCTVCTLVDPGFINTVQHSKDNSWKYQVDILRQPSSQKPYVQAKAKVSVFLVPLSSCPGWPIYLLSFSVAFAFLPHVPNLSMSVVFTCIALSYCRFQQLLLQPCTQAMEAVCYSNSFL